MAMTCRPPSSFDGSLYAACSSAAMNGMGTADAGETAGGEVRGLDAGAGPGPQAMPSQCTELSTSARHAAKPGAGGPQAGRVPSGRAKAACPASGCPASGCPATRALARAVVTGAAAVGAAITPAAASASAAANGSPLAGKRRYRPGRRFVGAIGCELLVCG